MSKVEEARALIRRVCDQIGFPPPTENQGLATWADESLDSLLVRGSDPWNVAHGYTIEALDAALVGSEPIVREQISMARDVAKEAASHKCECARPLVVQDEHGGYCVRCYSRPKKT